MAATNKNLRNALMVACGVIGVSGATAEATEVNTGAMVYSEGDRVTVVEAVAAANHLFDNGTSVNFKFVLDTLSGASASGATPASFTQTFTRPSGKGSYSTPLGATPLDDTFRDSRVAVSGGGSFLLNRLTTLSAGLYGSTEFDYSSLGVNAALSRDFNKRSTTLALRSSYFRDTVNPVGGRPIPFASMADEGQTQPRLAGNGNKNVFDAGLAWTQVLNRSTVAQLSYTYSKVDGYMTDPYKIVSEVDATSGDPNDYLYERRPDARSRHIIFSKVNHNFGRDIVSLSYRFLTDDWGIQSHTIDFTYRWNYSNTKYLRPHFRYYDQAAADFYQRYLVTGEALPDNVSADYRLGDMVAYTIGLKHGQRLGNGHDLSFRLEYYLQTGESHPSDAIGNLKDYDLYPNVGAIMFQVGYSWGS